VNDPIITLTADDGSARLDRFVVETLPAQSVTRGAVQRLIDYVQFYGNALMPQ